MRRTDPALLLVAQERRIAHALAIASALVFAVVWTPWAGGERAALFGIGLLFSASIALVARQGHRLWTAFASFLVGLAAPWGYASLLAAAFIVYAFWLVWRAHRSAKASVNLVAAPPAPERRSKPIESGRVTPKGGRATTAVKARRRRTRRS